MGGYNYACALCGLLILINIMGVLNGTSNSALAIIQGVCMFGLLFAYFAPNLLNCCFTSGKQQPEESRTKLTNSSLDDVAWSPNSKTPFSSSDLTILAQPSKDAPVDWALGWDQRCAKVESDSMGKPDSW